MSERGFGVAAGLDPAVATPLASRAEQLGYASIWSNDTPLASGLETLAAFAEGSDSLDLGVTIAVDRHSPEDLAADIERLGLPRQRLHLAVASGLEKKAVTRMREVLPELREKLGGVSLELSAMGPKMCALGGAAYDGVFVNWMTPDFITGAKGNVQFGAKEAHRDPPPPVLGYVRTALGGDAAERLAKEEVFYRNLHEGYINHFARLGAEEGTVGIAAKDAGEAQKALAAYEALDVIVVRALASGNLEAMSAVAEAAAPR